MDSLLIAIAALFVGIAIVPWLSARRNALAALDGFVVTAIGGVVFVHLLPQALLDAGWLAALAGAAGLVLPGLLERRSASREGMGSANTVMALAGVGLALHAFLDGAALASAELADGGQHAHASGNALAIAVIVHRLPMGLVLGLLARRHKYAPWIMGAVVALSTAAGFYLGTSAMPLAGARSLAVLQALVAGSLLHVVFAHPPGGLGASDSRSRASSGVGALLGLGLTVALAIDHPVAQHCDAELAATGALAQLATDAAPWLLAALLATGLVSAVLRPDHTRWLRGRFAFGQASRGLVAGLPLPICSCGILPVYAELLDRNIPLPAALAFLIGTPLLGLDALLISWPLFGPELTSARLVSAAVAAVLVAALVGRAMGKQRDARSHDYGHDHEHEHEHAHEHEHEHAHEHASQPALSERLSEGLRFGFGDLVDHLVPWLVFGFVLAALCEPIVHDAGLADWAPWQQVLAAAAVGLPLYLSASGATPLLAVLLHKGLAPGAALAFLITAPALNSETLARVRARHGLSLVLGLVGALWLVAAALGLGINAWSSNGGAIAELPELHGKSGDAGWLRWASLAVLGALSLASLLRSGARGWLGQLRVRYGEHVHRTHEGHACTHDHGHAHAHEHPERAAD